jgi:uncharacterized sulfatase
MSFKTDADFNKLKPNILIILADDLGYGDISSFGQKYYKTPNIDRIGKEGVTATSFYVPTPYCAPSRASLLTGRFPLRHKLIRNPTPDAHIEVDTIGLNPKEITIAEIFKSSGYTTKAIGKWHIGHYPKFFPVEQGFDEYYGILYSNDMRPVQIIQNKDTVQYPVNQRCLTKDYTKHAVDFIKKKQDEPFFLYLAHAMPHKPLAASKEFYTPETPDDLYADVVRELDWSIGEVIKTLEELELLDNTIVVFMSDNGPWYGGSTGGLKGMKATTWEGGIRVPMMIRYPQAFIKNSTSSVPLSSLDLLPTLTTLSNVQLPENTVFDGIDITRVLQNKTINHPAIFSLHNDEIMSVRKGDYKLFIQSPPGFKMYDLSGWTDPRGPDGTTIIAQTEQPTPANYPGIIPEKSSKNIQLFNLRTDPKESNDLSAKYPGIVEELTNEINQFKKSIQYEHF